LLEVTGDYIYAAFRDCNIVAKLSRTDGRVLWMKQLNIVIKDMVVFNVLGVMGRARLKG